MSRRDRFETVVSLRELRERQALTRLGAASAETTAASDRLERERRRTMPTPAAGAGPAVLQALRAQGLGAVEALEHARSELSDAEAAELRTRSELQRTHAEAEAARRLAERRKAQAALEARRAAERALDELVLLRRPRREDPR